MCCVARKTRLLSASDSPNKVMHFLIPSVHVFSSETDCRVCLSCTLSLLSGRYKIREISPAFGLFLRAPAPIIITIERLVVGGLNVNYMALMGNFRIASYNKTEKMDDQQCMWLSPNVRNRNQCGYKFTINYAIK